MQAAAATAATPVTASIVFQNLPINVTVFLADNISGTLIYDTELAFVQANPNLTGVLQLPLTIEAVDTVKKKKDVAPLLIF